MPPPRHRSGDVLADRRADYARGLAEGGDAAAAADLMQQALEIRPDWMAGRMRLGAYLEAAGRAADAIAAYRAVLAADPADACGASLKLAILGEAPTPTSAPAAFVRDLFDQYAEGFDRHLRNGLSYAAPEQIMAALRAAGAAGPDIAAVLDLGCGTGLMGTLLRPVAKHLVGIDLSPGMLAKARAKNIYDKLHEAGILDFAAGEASFELVCAADVLNYFGDLDPVLTGVAQWLRPGSAFGFTVEAHEGTEAFRLRDTMRYAHGRATVVELLQSAGLTPVVERSVILRQDHNAPVDGLVFVARKTR